MADIPSVPGPPQSLLDAQMWQQPQRRGPTQWEPGYKGTDANPLAPLARFYQGAVEPPVKYLMNTPDEALYLGAQLHPAGRAATSVGAIGRLGYQGLKKLAPASLAAGGLLAGSASEAEGGKIKALYNLSETIWKNVVTKKPTILKPGKDALSKGFHERGHGARKGTEGLHEDLQRAAENAAKEGKGTVNDIVAATRLLAPKHTKLLQEDLLRKAARSSARPRWLPPHPSLRGPR